MASTWSQDRQQLVVDRVLRRAEIARVTRKLKSRLAFAQYKATHGWERLSIAALEPHMQEEMERRQRERQHAGPRLLGAAADMTADKAPRVATPPQRKRRRTEGEDAPQNQVPWTQSSPVYASREAFESLPAPRTPPPAASRTGPRRLPGTEEGADLLMFLATSPSPAAAPRTAPSRMPSGLLGNHMTPRSLANGALLAPNTPSQHFDFSDFVHITPSPARKAWPDLASTAAATQRRLQFDVPDTPGSQTRLATRLPVSTSTSSSNSNGSSGSGVSSGGPGGARNGSGARDATASPAGGPQNERLQLGEQLVRSS